MQYAVSSTILIHLVICYVLIIKLDLAVTGVGIATMITCALNMLFVVIWTWRMTPGAVKPIPLNPIDLLRPRHVKIYMGISIPSIVMLCADWWAYEGIVILSAFISVGAMGSMAISYNYLFLIYSIPCGFQIGAVAVIGNIIGEENERLGKFMCLITLGYSSLLTVLVGTLTYVYSREIANAYTQDPDTLAVLRYCLRSLAVSISLLGFALSLQGALKALQKQNIASWILLLSLYGVSLPMSYFLAIKLEVGITGLWTGFSVGQAFVTTLYGIILLRTDW